MFNRISSLLHQAAEFSSQILTTDTAGKDEFKQRWKVITDIIADHGSIVELEDGLKVMVSLLHSEETELKLQDPGTVGPCLEFLLRHKIMDTLFTAAKNNYPPGMHHQVLTFFIDLLKVLDKPILHHVSIHQPILFQVESCGNDPSSVLCVREVQFIETLCIRLKKDPRLADFFIKEENEKKQFLLFNALLRLANSSGNDVLKRSFNCMLDCASLQHSSVTQALTAGYLPVTLASKLQYHFQMMPPNLRYSLISSCKRPWGMNSLPHSASGVAHVEALFSWIDYCDKIIAVSQPSLGKAVCESIREVFLQASLLPKLIKTKEEDILISTSILICALKCITCSVFLEECVLFVMNDFCGISAEDDMSILNLLTSRIDHINEEASHNFNILHVCFALCIKVCQVTLQLFDALLQSEAFGLVLEGLTNCGCVVQRCILSDDSMKTVRLELEKNTISYLSLIPDCTSSNLEEDFNSYLREAHSEVARIHDLCQHCSTSTCDSGVSADEGSTFLTALLNKLEALLDQPYEISLLVACLLTHLAAAPFPILKWLYQTDTEQRNVYTILKKVAGIITNRVERTPGLVVHMVEARRRLRGQLTSDLLSMPHNNLLEGSIVFVELIKELCAMMYANITWSMLALPPISD